MGPESRYGVAPAGPGPPPRPRPGPSGPGSHDQSRTATTDRGLQARHPPPGLSHRAVALLTLPWRVSLEETGLAVGGLGPGLPPGFSVKAPFSGNRSHPIPAPDPPAHPTLLLSA